MNVELLNGLFDTTDAKDLISQMIQLKVKYHENKIDHSTNEEDIKFREAKIKALQEQLYSFQKCYETSEGKLSLSAHIVVK